MIRLSFGCGVPYRQCGPVLTITEAEQVELRQLQQELLVYRRKVAPLPLKEIRQLHEELLKKAAQIQAGA